MTELMFEHSGEQTLSISDAQKEITRLPEHFERQPGSITVTRYGKPVMAILSFQEYKTMLETIEALQETLEILRDEELMAAFRASVQALQNGETVSWEDAKRELGLS